MKGDPRLSCQAVDGQSTVVYGNVKLISANVATMEYGQDGIPFSHKCRYLMTAFQEESFDVVAIQESRARHSETRVDGPYIRLIAAGHQGNAGVELWFLKTGFWASQGAAINVENLTVWHQTDRLMCVDLHWGQNVLTFCVAYAPQSGHAEEIIQKWWRNLSTVFDSIPMDRPVFLMGDLNAHIGCIPAEGIGSLCPDTENLTGMLLRQHCTKYRLLLPSTYHEWHEGVSHTYVHPKGTRHRLDYIAVRQFQQDAILSSWVAPHIELANGQCDHLPVAIQMQVALSHTSNVGFQRRAVYNRTKARETLNHKSHAILQVPTVPWEMEVNDHWHVTRHELQAQAKEAFPFEKRVQRQQYFDQPTWTAMCHRKTLRQEHRAAQRDWDLQQLSMYFKAWKVKQPPLEEVQEWHFHSHINRLQDALFVHQRNQCDQRFRALKKKAWRNWAIENANKLKKELIHGDVFRVLKPKRALAKAPRRALPGLRNNKGEWCKGKQDIALAWECQFGALENAQATSIENLLDKSCPRYQSLTVEDLLKIPTVYDLEQAMRCADVAKAPGVDGLGAEIFRQDPAAMARQLYPLLLRQPFVNNGWWRCLEDGSYHYGSARELHSKCNITGAFCWSPSSGGLSLEHGEKRSVPPSPHGRHQCSMEGAQGSQLRHCICRLGYGKLMPNSNATTWPSFLWISRPPSTQLPSHFFAIVILHVRSWNSLWARSASQTR